MVGGGRGHRLGQRRGSGFDCIFLLDVAGVAAIAPGETLTRVPVRFLFPALAVSHLKRGAHFTMWEGRTIGDGVI